MAKLIVIDYSNNENYMVEKGIPINEINNRVERANKILTDARCEDRLYTFELEDHELTYKEKEEVLRIINEYLACRVIDVHEYNRVLKLIQKIEKYL